MKKNRKYNIKEVGQCYGMLSPMLIGFALFTLYPLLLIIQWSFMKYSGYGEMRFIGLDNYIRAFTRDPQFWHSILIIFGITALKLMIEIPLALVVAFLLSKRKWYNTVLRSVYFVPSIVSVSVVGLIFYIMFEPYRGVVNYIMMGAGMIEKSLPWFSNQWLAMLLICLASVWTSFGTDMVLILTGLQNIDNSLYECSSIDGANKRQQFIKITIPMLAPTLQVVMLMGMLNTMKMTDLVLVLTNGQPGGRTEVVMTYIYKYFFTGELTSVQQYGYASAMSVITAIILGIITVFYLRASSKKCDIY